MTDDEPRGTPRGPSATEEAEGPEEIDARDTAELEALLEFIRASRSCDLTGYKRPTILRRVRRRMEVLGIDGIAAYQEVLERERDEFGALFDTLLINVTSFFRNPLAWEYVAREVISTIVRRTSDHDIIRIWSAGCASGEEPYTIAMLLAEELGIDETLRRVRIYATDVDEHALSQARLAFYPEAALDDVPAPLRDRYFTREPGGVRFHRRLRRAVVFGRNDITTDAPISNLDLLCCRNTLMYFNAETQLAILSRFHFALAHRGFLFLGRAEMLHGGGNGQFTPVSMPHRVFVAAPDRRPAQRSNRTSPRPSLRPAAPVRPPPVADPPTRPSSPTTLDDLAFQRAQLAQVVVDAGGVVTGINDAARALLGLTEEDLGRPLHELRLSFDPVELRGPIEAVLANGTGQALGTVDHTSPAEEQRALDVRVQPLLQGEGAVSGVAVTYMDITPVMDMYADFRRTASDLEVTFQELQAANEELETTNEELLAANEELETTNEELHSSNEELETTNAEVRMVNENVERVNTTLVDLNDRLNEMISFSKGVIEGFGAGVLVLDTERRVTHWNSLAHDLWGLRGEEVEGQPFFDLDIGLPLDPLRTPVQHALEREGREALDLAAINRRGRSITCHTTVSSLVIDGAIAGVVIVMDPT